MFTAKGVLLFISVILLLIIAWNTDITMVYILFVITFVMFVLSFIHLKLSIPDCLLARDLQEIAYEGDMLNVKLTIRNKRGLGFYLFELVDRFMGSEPGKEEISLFILNIKAKEVKKISYAIDCYKRGLWRLGPIAIISQDALGFFRMTRSIKCFSEVLVYPTIFKVFSFPPLASGSVSWMGVETAKISGDSHEFFGIREYQRGDKMSRIHWPSTAKRNKLIVKQFERNAVQEVTIVMDLKKGHDIGVGRETTLEYSVKIAGSIAKYLLSEGAFVQMIGYRKTLPLGKGESHMYKLLNHLATVQADGDLSLSRTLEEASFLTPHRSTLIAIMLDNDMDSLTSLVQFKVKGIKLILIVLSASTFGQIEESEYLSAEDVKRFDEALAGLEAYVYRVSKGDDLEKKFEAV